MVPAQVLSRPVHDVVNASWFNTRGAGMGGGGPTPARIRSGNGGRGGAEERRWQREAMPEDSLPAFFFG